jgi:hypothetical protein
MLAPLDRWTCCGWCTASGTAGTTAPTLELHLMGLLRRIAAVGPASSLAVMCKADIECLFDGRVWLILLVT